MGYRLPFSFKRPVPNGRGSSGFWLVPESLCFFLPNHRTARPGVASCLLTRNIHTGQLLALFVWVVGEGLLEQKSYNHSTKCRGDFSPYPQETRRKYAGLFTGIVILLHLKHCEFCTLTEVLEDVDKYFGCFSRQNEFFLPAISYITCCDWNFSNLE